MSTAKIYNGTGWDEISGGSRWDYQQSTVPSPTPTESGVTWLRTLDFGAYVFDQPNGLWIAMGSGAERSMHGQDANPPVGASSTADAWMHDAKMNTNLKSWRTPYRMVVVDMTIGSSGAIVGNDWGIQIVENASVVHTLFYDGTLAYNTENDIGLLIFAEKRVLLRLVVGATGAPAFRWTASIYFKRAISG